MVSDGTVSSKDGLSIGDQKFTFEFYEIFSPRFSKLLEQQNPQLH